LAPDDGAVSASPSVSFVEPANGAQVDNPVTFTIAATEADEVEVLALTFSEMAVACAAIASDRDARRYHRDSFSISRATVLGCA
jgi:hypothetical protein